VEVVRVVAAAAAGVQLAGEARRDHEQRAADLRMIKKRFRMVLQFTLAGNGFTDKRHMYL
jgi:hypothetical protein